MIKPLPLNSF